MNEKKLEKSISVLGSAVLAAAFFLWCANSGCGAAGYIAAAVSAALMLWLCLKFVPVLCAFLRSPERDICPARESVGVCRKIFAAILLWDVTILALGFVLRRALGFGESVGEYFDFWLCTDSRHYMDIARDWYLSEGSIHRLVQLVFLPGYPIAVRAVSYLTGSILSAGLVVSALSFAGAGCVLYKLLALDMDEGAARRAVCFFALSPASFFFAAPMSESLFMFCSLLSLYLMRRGRTVPSVLFGAYAAFTRSLGVILLVPLALELIRRRARVREYLALAVVPLGFAAYCLINYAVSGDAFKFMYYQGSHWGQRLGLFFNTAAYQTENLLSSPADRVLGLWLPNVLAQLIALALVIAAAKKLRASYTAHFIAYFVVAVGATWLLSAPRYLAAAPAIPAALGLLTDKNESRFLTAALSFAAFLAYFVPFLLRWQVW